MNEDKMKQFRNGKIVDNVAAFNEDDNLVRITFDDGSSVLSCVRYGITLRFCGESECEQ